MSPGHHEHQSSHYGNDSWMGLGGYSQTPQQQGNQGQHGYSGYEYGNSAPIPLEPSYPMSRPPPYAQPQHSQMPPPLIMPQHNIWPSMLATSNNYQQPILPAVSTQTPISATSMGSDLTPTSAKTSTSRRKLTDDERRMMCLEAENNPTMKQTQIGAKFNVERSTVSKILRQKDKYMKVLPKEEVLSPGKKTKSKNPDVEKTLVNWVRNQQRRGLPITTDELRKQAAMFSAGREEQRSYTSTEWLDKFRNKYLNESSRSTSREDTAETSTSHSETLDDSPISPIGFVSPISMNDDSAHLKSERGEDMFDFGVNEFEQSPLLPHGFSSTDASSEVILSPLSPDMNRDYMSNQFDAEHTDMTSSRQRSMTLPQLALASRPGSSHVSMPSLPVRSVTSIHESRSTSIDPRQTMKRHKSVPDIHDTDAVRYTSMQPPPLPRSADISPVGMPTSPMFQDDSYRALHNIKVLLEQRPDVAEPDDYVMIGKLMEKLRLLKSRSPGSTPILPGGMRRIEMIDSPRLSKKRTMIEMSR